MAAIVVLCTASSLDEARQLTDHLIGEKLAACVSVAPNVQSTYWWQGAIEHAEEALLIIKSDSTLFEALSDAIRKKHSYTVPEILALPVHAGNPAYLKWLQSSVVKSKKPKRK